MATWLVKAEIVVEADTRQEAWEEGNRLLASMNGVVISCPQQPEPKGA